MWVWVSTPTLRHREHAQNDRLPNQLNVCWPACCCVLSVASRSVHRYWKGLSCRRFWITLNNSRHWDQIIDSDLKWNQYLVRLQWFRRMCCFTANPKVNEELRQRLPSPVRWEQVLLPSVCHVHTSQLLLSLTFILLLCLPSTVITAFQ